MDNIILLSDSYKTGHYLQYPPKTNTVYSYFESRGGRSPHTMFFGLQYYLKKYLQGVVVTEEKIQEAKEIITAHMGNERLFNEKGWRYILENHGGKLPVRIKAVPEGAIVDNFNVLVTVENTDPNCYWLTNYLETLLVQVWYASTVATQSNAILKMLTEFAELTGDTSLVNFKLHDFGFRGVSSVESAGIGGLAHLINFLGTDTMEALVFAKKYYNCDCAGFSIPASEHSTITSWGKENEDKAMENMLDQYSDCPLIACVSDSYDIFKACSDIWGTKLKDKIMKRNGTLVIRPDSGDPKTVILQILNILWDKFGGNVNNKGYKVLDPHVRVIQGDGVNYDSIKSILEAMEEQNYSIDNIAFGMGGALLQKLDRDTQKFAFKCSSININGKEIDVYKKPITDIGKMSKKGRLKLVAVEGNNGKNKLYTIKRGVSQEKDILEEVFLNGKITKKYTLDEVRENSKKEYCSEICLCKNDDKEIQRHYLGGHKNIKREK